jgi:AMIN domain
MRPRPGAPVATFPGFRLLPSGGSRIYVELTKNVNVDERKTGGALVYTLRGAQVLSRNNKNALITTHFATPVARARLVPAGLDLELVIDLRKGVEATHQVVAADNGTVRLEIDFPPGDYPLVPGLYEPPLGGPVRSGASREGSPETIDEAPEAPAPARPAPAPGPRPAAPEPTGTENKGSPPAP